MLAFIGLWLSAPAAWPQSEPEEKLYAVEVLVFRHASTPDTAYRRPDLPDLKGAIDLLIEDEPDLLPFTSSVDGALGPDSPDARIVTPNVAGPSTQSGGTGAQRPEGRSGPEDSAAIVFADRAATLFDPRLPPSPLLSEKELSPFQPLKPEELQLSDAWRRLTRSATYAPLVHFGWRQPASPFGEPLAIRIHGGPMVIEPEPEPMFPVPGQEPNPGLKQIDGTVALERGRFLHLRIDLALHLPVEYGQGQMPPSTLLDPNSESDSTLGYRSYLLRDRRQVTRGSVNYFDHRHFGLIAVVTEWLPSDTTDPEAIDPVTAGALDGASPQAPGR